jgi:3,4-dihydroxy 2-butanone 4-phosphate synthase/GTP cyclohydrolase II
VSQIRLITNNPRKIAGLKGYGLEVVDRLPLLIEANDYNSAYLATKATKLGHLLLQTYLVTAAIQWSDQPSLTERYDRLEKLRYLAKENDLLLQEETRPVAIAVFSHPSLIFHLGLDQPDIADHDWFKQPDHPYRQGVQAMLQQVVSTFTNLGHLELLISTGSDPLTGLQVQLERVNSVGVASPLENRAALPNILMGELQTQKIYKFT